MTRHNTIKHKNDVQTHNDRPWGRNYPALNVKAYHFGRASDIEKATGCTEEVAEKAMEYAFNMASDAFWEDVKEAAADTFGSGVKVYSAGRSGGWLIVEGLDDIDTWDAIGLSKWRKFAKWVDTEIEYQSLPATILDNVISNEWAKPYAEEYNFVDMPASSHICIADMKQQAIAAGFGPVVRK